MLSFVFSILLFLFFYQVHLVSSQISENVLFIHRKTSRYFFLIQTASNSVISSNISRGFLGTNQKAKLFIANVKQRGNNINLWYSY